MVLTKSELISALKKEVHILTHLAGKLDTVSQNYRPTPKQRSSLELLKYMAVMGPALIRFAKSGAFDPAAWTAADQAVQPLTLEQTIAALSAQAATYESLVGGLSEQELREEIEMFGTRQSRGAFIVSSVLGACAAYRTQLFLYLKACGREELNTMNLWAGVDAPMATA